MVQIPSFDPIEYLVGRRFPKLAGLMLANSKMLLNAEAVRKAKQAAGLNLRTLAALDHEPTPTGASTKSSTSDSIMSLLAEVEDYRATLRTRDANSIHQMVAEERKKEAEEHKVAAERAEADRFFNRSNATANFDHYCKCANWTLDEAIALSLGKQPTVVNWKAVSPYVSLSPFAHEYSLRRDLTQRAVWAQQLFDPVYPSIFLAWARQIGMRVSEALTSRAVASGISLKGWKDLYEELAAKSAKETTELRAALQQSRRDTETLTAKLTEMGTSLPTGPPEKPLNTRERESLQILAFISGVKAYGYDPDHKSGAASKAEVDTEKLGLRITDDTIRKAWKAGADLAPGDWRQRLGLKPNSASG